MRVTLKFDSINVEQMRAILAECSRERDNFGQGMQGPAWRPRVECNGPEAFAVEVNPLMIGPATRIMKAAENV